MEEGKGVLRRSLFVFVGEVCKGSSFVGGVEAVVRVSRE